MAYVDELASTLRTDLAKYRACRDAILAGAQIYDLDGQKISRATLFRVEDSIRSIEAQLGILDMGGMRSLQANFGGRD